MRMIDEIDARRQETDAIDIKYEMSLGLYGRSWEFPSPPHEIPKGSEKAKKVLYFHKRKSEQASMFSCGAYHQFERVVQSLIY